MNRRKFIKYSATAGLLSWSGISLAKTLQATKNSNLSILSTNDFHSRIEPYPKTDRNYPGQGGMARRASMIQNIRNQADDTLLLDAGDIFQGTPYFNAYHGSLEIELMNQMKYDAATIGNHEFDGGLDNLATQIAKANFPFICSNYDFTNTPLEGLTKTHLILEKSGLKIGIYGLGIELDGLVSPKNFQNTLYKDPIETAHYYENLLKSQGCDLIIALSHLGFEYKGDKVSDHVLAKESGETDIIIGGHTHTFLTDVKRIQNKKGNEVIISQSGWSGLVLGQIDLKIKKSFTQNVNIIYTAKFLLNQE